MSGTTESPTPPPPPPNDEPNDNVLETSEPPTSLPPPNVELHHNTDLMSDIVLWRRNQLNVGILLAATVTWVVMEVYKYNFVTLLSWLAIALLSCLFFWGSMHRFLKKEAPDLSELEISEEMAGEQAKQLKQRVEDGIRLMFHVSSEREWFVFAGVVAVLYLISLAAKHLDFPTLLFIGIAGAMTGPLTYVKNEQRIRGTAENLRMRLQRLNEMIEENLKKIKTKIAGKQKEIKQKKTE